MLLRATKILLFVALLTSTIFAQTVGGSASTLRHGASAPATCSPNAGQIFLSNSGTLYVCTATNTWTAVSGGGGGGGVAGVASFNGQTGAVTYTPSWTSISGKPSTFAPSAHNHVKSEITDFAHTHPWTDVTGKPNLAASIVCGGTDKINAYNATTGVFTCAPDQNSGSGGGTTYSFNAPLSETGGAVSIDLSGYTTTSALTTALSSYATTSALTSGLAGKVSTTTTVAGKALSGNITIACSDLSDGGDSCTKSVGTTAGTVAAGNHTHTGVYEPANANIQAHISSTSNPHSTTAAQVGAEPAITVLSKAKGGSGQDNSLLTFPASGTLARTTDNVATATALAANGTNCSAGSYPLGVDASGNAESCTAVPSSSNPGPWNASSYYASIPSTNYLFTDEILGTYSPAVTVTIPVNCSGSVLKSVTAAATGVTIYVKKGATTICTGTIAAASTEGTFTGTGGTFTSGDEFVVQNGTSDGNASGLKITIAGTWQ